MICWASRTSPAAELVVSYAPEGEPFQPAAGTLEHSLTERYCLYTLDERQHAHRAEIHHRPWTLRPAHAMFASNTMTAPLGLAAGDGEPLLHFCRRQDVIIWSPQPLEGL